MRVVVDSATLMDAALCFERGNQDAARVHEALAGQLSHLGAMAGDASLAEALDGFQTDVVARDSSAADSLGRLAERLA